MRATTMTLLMMLSAGTVFSKPALRDVASVDGALLAVGLANEIRMNCPDISGRLVKGYRTILAIRDHARALGYTDDEIDAYRKSEDEKARLKARGSAWLSRRGVDRANPADWCRVGREEIDQKSAIGALLRER